MRVELTGDIFQGRCEVQTEICRARVSGSVAVVKRSDGNRTTVCGACLHEMAERGEWVIPGSRPQPRRLSASEAALAGMPQG
jgi:ribosome-binding protein aMBF1 (putative translation factor)